jgi:iron complex outermembrane receptor protein
MVIKSIAASRRWLILTAALAIPSLAPGQQTADESREPQGTLSEVVVTAQFKRENVQDTPIAITAVSAEMLEARSALNILDIANAAPNVTMRLGSTGFGKTNATYIRGVGQGDFLYAYSPRVSFYIDDVYHSTVFGSVFELLDVDRVEVLRGPQGTLFGRNAVGGAIRLFSMKPKGDDSGYIELTGGDFNRQGVKGVIDLPLIEEKLMARFSGGYRASDGWVDVYDWACLNPTFAGLLNRGAGNNNERSGCKTGTLGGTKVLSGRAQLRWLPTSTIENNLTFDYMDDNSDATTDVLVAAPHFTAANPTTGAGNGAGAIPAASLGNGLALWFNNIGGPVYNIPVSPSTVLDGMGTPLNLPSPELIASMFPNDQSVSYAIFGNPGLSRPGAAVVDPNINDLVSWGIGNVLDWDLTEHLHLKSISAYRTYEGQFGSSQASLPVPVQEAYQETRHRQFSQEIQLSGQLFENKLDWATGVFYIDTKEVNNGRVQFEGFALGGGAFVQDFLIDDPATLENKSAFLHGVLHVSDKMNLTAGVRYSDETKTYTFSRQYSFFVFGPGGPSFFQGTESKDQRWNPRVALDYNFSDDLLLYTSYATGFTAGGFNGRPFGPGDVFAYDPEDVTSYEIGFKSELLGRTLRLNGAVYYMDWEDRQIGLGCIGQPGCPRPATPFFQSNGGDASIRGFELETEAHPTDAWLITAAVGYKDFKWESLSPFAAPLTLASPDTGVPEWTGNIGTQYTFNLANGSTLTPRLDGTYNSEIPFSATDLANPFFKQEAYWVSNARLTWRSSSDTGWTVAAAVTNLGDEEYFTGRFDGRTGFGYATSTIATPRQWQVTIRKSF